MNKRQKKKRMKKLEKIEKIKRDYISKVLDFIGSDAYKRAQEHANNVLLYGIDMAYIGPMDIIKPRF